MGVSGRTKDYFHFNRAERRGMIILFILLLCTVGLNMIIPFEKNEEPVDWSAFEKAVQDLEAMQPERTDSMRQKAGRSKGLAAGGGGLTPVPFDPNGLPEKEWLAMGLTVAQVRVIKNYEAKGGRFASPGDLAKVYSISEDMFKELEPFIRIDVPPEDTKILQDSARQVRAAEPAMTATVVTEDPGSLPLLELNSADTLDLQQVRGIGPSFARRIVRYRDMLGGYAMPEQLLEVYGMDSVRYAGISRHIAIDTLHIRKIDVNTAGIKELMRHPYIEFYHAKLIVSGREADGPYGSVEAVRKRTGMPGTLFRRIAPYLRI